MPREGYERPAARCPFFRSDSRKNKLIRCEGVFDNGTLTHKFRYQSGQERQMALFCAADYSKCEIYRAIMEAKYPDD